MQTSTTTQQRRHVPIADLQLVSCEGNQSRGYKIEPMTLAYLDFGLFKSLRRLGVSRERICSALNVSYEDYDYLLELSMT